MKSDRSLASGVKRYPTGRPVVRGTQGIVSAGHQLTAMSAMQMLLSGGNAFDAAVAAGFTAAVVEPTAPYSIATEATIMLYHAASGRLRVLSGQGVAAQRATIDFYRKRGLDKIPVGPGPNSELSMTVPGVVDAFTLLLKTYGIKTLGEAIAPAIYCADRGFQMYEHMHRRLGSSRPPWSRTREQFGHYPPGGMEVFYPGGEVLPVGQILVQKQLAATMKAMVQAETDAAGDRLAGLEAARDVFYRGDIARTIVRCSDRFGGMLSLEDLAGYHSTFEDPVSTTYMGYEVFGQSTWTQGPVALQALNILEQFDLRAMGHNSTKYIHTLTEAMKLAFADRERYYGDPEFARVPIAGLISKEYAAERARLIRPDRAFQEMPEPGDPWRYCKEAGPGPTPAMPLPTSADGGSRAEDDTTHYAIIDRDGNVVCVTPSGGPIYKSVFVPELGCALSTRSEMFFLDPQHPNGLQPGKRPRTTLVNYMLFKDGRPVATIGCPGGDRQAQADIQMILNMVLFGMDPQEAIEAPRFVTLTLIGSFYPRVYLPGQLDVEVGISEDVRSELESLGHKVVDVDADSDFGTGVGAALTTRDPETGAMSAGADPRKTAYAIGW